MQCREHSGNFLSGPVKTDDIRCLLLLRNSIRVAKVLLSRVEIEILSKFCAIRSQLSFVRMMELCQGSKDHENLTSTQLSTDIWWQRLKSCCKWNEENCQLTTFTNCHNCTFLSLSRPIHSVTAICNFQSQQLPINGMTIDNVECRESICNWIRGDKWDQQLTQLKSKQGYKICPHNKIKAPDVAHDVSDVGHVVTDVATQAAASARCYHPLL